LKQEIMISKIFEIASYFQPSLVFVFPGLAVSSYFSTEITFPLSLSILNSLI